MKINRYQYLTRRGFIKRNPTRIGLEKPNELLKNIRNDEKEIARFEKLLRTASDGKSRKICKRMITLVKNDKKFWEMKLERWRK